MLDWYLTVEVWIHCAGVEGRCEEEETLEERMCNDDPIMWLLFVVEMEIRLNVCSRISNDEDDNGRLCRGS